MPRPRALTRFSPEFFRLFEAAITRPITIPVSSITSAEKFRLSLYSFRTSLIEYFDELPSPRLALMSTALVFNIEKSPRGACLRVGLSGESEQTIAIREILDNEPSAPV